MKHSKLTYAAQGIAATILFMASGMKFFGDPASIAVFEQLEMEPVGRFLIAFIEMAAALLLISPFAVAGAALAFSVMCGAIIAHTTRLGFVVNEDSGLLAGLLFVVLICSCFVLFSRRKEIPLVADTF